VHHDRIAPVRADHPHVVRVHSDDVREAVVPGETLGDQIPVRAIEVVDALGADGPHLVAGAVDLLDAPEALVEPSPQRAAIPPEDLSGVARQPDGLIGAAPDPAQAGGAGQRGLGTPAVLRAEHR